MSDAQLPPTAPRRFAIRFSLRWVLAVTTLLCFGLGYWVIAAENQRKAIEAVRQVGARSLYTYEMDSNGGFSKNPRTNVPKWLLDTFGPDFFFTLDGVYFDGPQVDDGVVAKVSPALRRASTLRWIVFNNTSITDDSLGHVAELTQLERLNIRSQAPNPLVPKRMDISDSGLAKLRTLRRLKALAIDHCSLDGSGLAHFDSITQLEELYLERTNFNDSGAQNLYHCPRLKCLNLSFTLVSDASAKAIAQLDKLEELYVRNCWFTDEAMPEIARMKRLRTLDLSGTQVSDKGIAHLRPLDKLVELELYETKINTPPIAAFQRLQSLKVAHTEATDALLEEVSKLPELHDLDCEGCKLITDAGVRNLMKSKSLATLFFPDQRGISKEAIQELSLAKPSLMISF